MESRPMDFRTVLAVVLIVLLIGALPTWPYSAGWGYYPSGGIGLVLIVLLVLLLARRA
jgi:Protein of unknown function (DUF3309)